MDFGQLAQLSNPGQAPQGDLWGAVNRFNTLDNINQQALQASIPLAQLAAQKETQANKEYMIGAPGREDQARLANMNAAYEVQPENFDRKKLVERMEQELKTKEIQAKFNDVTADIAPFADGYSQAKSEEEKNKYVMAARGAKLRNGYVMGTNPEEDHAILEVAGKSRANNPTLQVKRDVATTAANAQLGKAAIAANAGITIAELNNSTKMAIAQVNAKAKENKPLSPVEQALVTMYGDGKQITDVEGAQRVLEFKIAERVGTTEMKGQQTAETLNNILGGNTTAATPKVPAVPPSTNTTVPSKALPSPNTKPGALPVQQALSMLEQAKGTENEEKYIKFFVDTYPGVALPAWAQKK